MSRPSRSRACRPGVEPLEGRSLLSVDAPLPYLFRPIPEGAPLAEHIHPHLTIVIDGRILPIPAGIGIGPNGNLPIHTHDASGFLHVEATVPYLFHLRDFFAIIGRPFNPRQLGALRADAHHVILMTVNGRLNGLYGNLPLLDGENIVIWYLRFPR